MKFLQNLSFFVVSFFVSALFESQAFTDIHSSSEKTITSFLENSEIMSGYDDNTFRPLNTVNRAEVLKILSHAGIINPSQDNSIKQFLDVPRNAWFYNFINASLSQGIIQGVSDDYFYPERKTNRVEFLKILANVFELPRINDFSYHDVDSDAWYIPYVWIAASYDIFDNDKNLLHPHKNITRIELARAIYNIFHKTDNAVQAKRCRNIRQLWDQQGGWIGRFKNSQAVKICRKNFKFAWSGKTKISEGICRMIRQNPNWNGRGQLTIHQINQCSLY